MGWSPRVGNRNPLQYSLENSTDRGAWWAIVHGVVKRRTWQHTFTRTIAGIWNSEKKGEDKKGCFAWRAALLSRMWGKWGWKENWSQITENLGYLSPGKGKRWHCWSTGALFSKRASKRPAKTVWPWGIGAWVSGQLRNPLFCFLQPRTFSNDIECCLIYLSWADKSLFQLKGSNKNGCAQGCHGMTVTIETPVQEVTRQGLHYRFIKIRRWNMKEEIWQGVIQGTCWKFSGVTTVAWGGSPWLEPEMLKNGPWSMGEANFHGGRLLSMQQLQLLI